MVRKREISTGPICFRLGANADLLSLSLHFRLKEYWDNTRLDLKEKEDNNQLTEEVSLSFLRGHCQFID